MASSKSKQTEKDLYKELKQLSRLQSVILAIGHMNRQAGRMYKSGTHTGDSGWLGPVDVTPTEIKKEYYQFPFDRRGRLYFSVQEIGKSRYVAASASISKAFSRLEKKGLVERRCDGLFLTDKGLEVASMMN